MNKDVIYIEPEDDITDIINRLKSSKQKVVALVPPKKLGVLRSAVNNKLIIKAAKQAGKAVVMVTPDPSLTKIAISAGIPVAKTLQSRPQMPDAMPRATQSDSEEVIEEPEDDPDLPAEPAKKTPTTKEEKSADVSLNSTDIESDAEDESEEKQGKSKKSKNNKPIPKLEKYRKFIIIGAVAGVLLICFLVWAIVFAPAAKITVAIKTTANNFSEDVSFVTNATAAKVDAGVFHLEKQEYKGEESVDFQATGEKDVGEKATGTLSISYYFGNNEDGDTISIPSGTTFTYNGLNYISTAAASLSWGGDDSECESGSSMKNGCRISTSVAIQANASGANYNVDANHTGWTASLRDSLYISNPSAISGGTSKVIKVVQASDVAAAKEKLTTKSSGNTDLKDKLIDQFSDDTYVIESSYATNVSDPVSSPAIGEEASSGSCKLTVTSVATIYGVEKTAISQYINKIAGERLAEDQKIYDIGNPFFEKFLSENNSFTAKLKTTTHSGPKVTPEEVMEKAKGRKIGEVQTLLRSINGVSNVNVEKSVFWMGSIPNDENKVQIEMTVEDQ